MYNLRIYNLPFIYHFIILQFYHRELQIAKLLNCTSIVICKLSNGKSIQIVQL